MTQDTFQTASPPDALRAQIARSRVAMALSGVADDMALQVVNGAFSTLTGYPAAEALGRNCRFLQGPGTPPEQVRAMSLFLHDDDRDDGRFPVANQTREGRDFLNLVFMAKLRDARGGVRFVLASQFDATHGRDGAAQAQGDADLSASLTDLRRVTREFGLIMADSSEMIARSISMLARLSLRDE